MEWGLIVLFVLTAEHGLEFDQEVFYVVQLDAEEKPAARRQSHARPMDALAEAYDPFDAHGNAAGLDAVFYGIRQRNATSCGARGFIALEAAIDANEQFFR